MTDDDLPTFPGIGPQWLCHCGTANRQFRERCRDCRDWRPDPAPSTSGEPIAGALATAIMNLALDHREHRITTPQLREGVERVLARYDTRGPSPGGSAPGPITYALVERLTSKLTVDNELHRRAAALAQSLGFPPGDVNAAQMVAHMLLLREDKP